ncbi:MAG: tetratricopeptide repeat protein [Gemmataceae bacterium]
MRKLPTKLSGVVWALIVLACLPAALVLAEERDSNLRKQALKLNDITGNDAQSGERDALLKDKAHAKKLVAEAARMAAEKPHPFTNNATFILGTLALSKKIKDYSAAETFWRLHLEQAKELHSAKGIMAAYRGLLLSAYAKRKYAEAEKLCKEARDNEIIGDAINKVRAEENDEEAIKERLTLMGFILEVIEEEAVAIARQGNVKRAIELIDRKFPDKTESWFVLDLKGDVYRIADKNKEALKIYEEEIERVKNDNDLKKKDQEKQLDKIHYWQSGLYIELGQVEKAEEVLKELLAKHPDEPKYNNDLGYVWADHDMHLAEAEKMIRKAIEEDRKKRQKADSKYKPDDEIKDNGAYLDSLGWVLFKQKKYVEAKRYLRQAVRNTVEEGEDESVEIYDHLGDVLMALGQKPEAVAAWKKGVEIAGDTKREQKRKEVVRKKLKANE